MASRSLSYSEVRSLLDCEAQWDFRYSDALAGNALRPKTTKPILDAGSMWDAGVKTWNRTGDLPSALTAMEQYRLKQTEQVDPFEVEKVNALLLRYTKMNPPMHTTATKEYTVDISPTFRLHVGADDTLSNSYTTWYVEYKLRNSLTSPEYLQRDLQTRLYVYGARKAGIPIEGIIWDETLNEMPAEVNYNKDGRPSKVQTCSVEDYLKGCRLSGHLPNPDVVKKLEGRKVHQRVLCPLYEWDLIDMENTLRNLYARITYLEQGILRPSRVRNSMLCRRCDFNMICERPEPDLIDMMFNRKPAKRNRV